MLAIACSASVFAQAEIHRFGRACHNVNGAFSIQLLGSAPAAFQKYFDLYLIDTSTDLVNWTFRTTLLRTNNSTGPLTYFDTEAVGLNRRFYRMRTNHLFTPLPPPTGRYGVGMFSRLLSDLSRTNRYGAGTARNFWGLGLVRGEYCSNPACFPGNQRVRAEILRQKT